MAIREVTIVRPIPSVIVAAGIVIAHNFRAERVSIGVYGSDPC
jgi:hypothetical protein